MTQRIIVDDPRLRPLLTQIVRGRTRRLVGGSIVSVTLAFAAWLAPTPATATGFEQSRPVLAAATVLGAIEEAVAMLNRCREVDDSNAATNDGLLVIFGLQNRPVIERIDVVLRGEGTRWVLNAIVSNRTNAPVEAAFIDRSGGQATDLFHFTKVVVSNFSEEERIDVIEMLWEVAYADGVLTGDEDTLIRGVAGLIDVSDWDRGDAKLRVRKRLEGNHVP